MMDPLSAFNLACGIIQVLDFSTKALSRCKELYKDGTVHDYEELEVMTKRLANLSTDLQLPTGTDSTGASQIPDDQSLRDTAKGCSKVADQLVGKLQALRVQGPHRKRQAFMKSIKAVRESKEIRNVEQLLAKYQHVLNTQILAGLRSVQSQMHSLQS